MRLGVHCLNIQESNGPPTSALFSGPAIVIMALSRPAARFRKILHREKASSPRLSVHFAQVLIKCMLFSSHVCYVLSLSLNKLYVQVLYHWQDREIRTIARTQTSLPTPSSNLSEVIKVKADTVCGCFYLWKELLMQRKSLEVYWIRYRRLYETGENVGCISKWAYCPL